MCSSCDQCSSCSCGSIDDPTEVFCNSKIAIKNFFNLLNTKVLHFTDDVLLFGFEVNDLDPLSRPWPCCLDIWSIKFVKTWFDLDTIRWGNVSNNRSKITRESIWISSYIWVIAQHRWAQSKGKNGEICFSVTLGRHAFKSLFTPCRTVASLSINSSAVFSNMAAKCLGTTSGKLTTSSLRPDTASSLTEVL